GHAGRNLERAVADVAGLLAEDRAEQLLLGGELALALRRDLSDQDVAGVHLGADAYDTRVVEVLEGLFTDVRDVLRDLFLAELGVTGDALELLDVNRGVDVFLNNTLTDEDRVFEVVTLPGHERDEHVLAQSELTLVGGRTVRQDITRLDDFARTNHRLLRVAGALVRALVLHQVVDVRDFVAFTAGRAHHDALRVDALHDPVTARHCAHARVHRHSPFHAGSDEGSFAAEAGDRLTLHVRAHERAV